MQENIINPEKIKEASNKYKDLELKEFIKNVLIECGYNLKRIENVYIGELVKLPSVVGFLRRDDKYIMYFTSEHAEIGYEIYDEPCGFMMAFMRGSYFYSR